MDSPTKNKTSEATGISRSGRVRKKSSKLTDFESPDEIDTRFKRRTDRPQKVATPKTMSEDSDSYMDEEIIDVKDEPLEVEEWGVEGEEMEEGEEEEEEEESVGGEDGGEGNLQEFSDSLQVDEDSTDVSRETSSYTQAQSLYFSEKQGKKSIVMKGGQVVRRKKAQRKDKGKSRFTAYMLWAREVRPGIIQANPNMDFSAVNKRLGELWALVPTTQKYNWKRRAKRLAAKGNQKGGLISTGRPSRPPPPARANLINKGGVKPAPRPDPNPTPPPPSLTSQGAGHHRQPGQKGQRLTDLPSPAPYRVTGTNPIDVAAHIKLLGESLNNIGQKLKEHEVSG
ncbi:HMG box-containing protein 4-like isoform X2 [Eriocheir sinensis]|uniref:HMG box-containing protein 4-like isoform X2 n=1 Tax=Eriocheir sinensis TaxID=95602 RepID=UPI0021C7D1DA|nr:HMG box-containing protein 4-like isoform X2 [Eriocheir sinensis]